MTDMTEKTKQPPIIGKYSAFPEKSAMHAAKPPRESEPVSPIKRRAGETLNSKYASKAPTSAKASVGNPSFPVCNTIKIPNVPKKGTLTPAASPSSPSVKLTAFTVAIKTNTAIGNIHAPTSKDAPKKGICKEVSPALTQYTPAKIAIAV